MNPLVVLAVGVAIVLGMILVLRLNAFLALITAAIVVSFLSPGETAEKVTRVAEAFGVAAGKVGVPIAMAAVIGSCLLASGAAERIVRSVLRLVGERQAGAALATSGFLLAVPVFFDTVFFLLVPLARSLYQSTRRNYLFYVVAIATGAAMAHTLVPPTPGPLIVADQLGVDIGLMMLVGAAVSVPAVLLGLLTARVMDRVIKLKTPPQLDALPDEDQPTEAVAYPGLLLASAPIVIPVVLVATRTVLQRLSADAKPGAALARLSELFNVLGDPNLALLLAAAAALAVFALVRKPSRSEFGALVEDALLGAGVIILVTAGGGAFGAMLKAAQIGPAIEQAFAGERAAGLALLWLAFGVSSLLKICQGSSTVAMITSSAMIAAMIEGQPLAYNPVYLAVAIGCGSLFGVWMNDSGFWIFCRMGGLTEAEGLKTWTVQTAVTGLAAMLLACVLAVVLPLPPAA